MPQTRSSSSAAEQTQPPPPKRTRKRKNPPTTSATPTLTTPTATEFNAMKDQMNALTTATQSIQRSLAAILPPTATPQAPAVTPNTSPTGHPTLPPTLLDGATGTHADPLVAAILGNDLANDKSKDKSTPDERTETTLPLSSVLTPHTTQASPGLHVPLDTGIPGPTKERIWENKFLNLKTLLPALQSAPQYTVSLSGSQTPTLTLANRNDSGKQTLSLDQWTNAFLVYHFIYIQRHPTLSPQLISYLHLIRTLAARKANWLRYDEQFRQYREKCPVTPWDTPHMQLYVDALYNANPSPPTPSTRSPSSSSTTSKSIPTGFCFQYHKPNGQCFKHECLYKHYCFKCSGAHKAPLCPNSSSHSAPRKQ
ncbi:uncharacterized protein LOC118416647 [Branchiostoma floridae]|uniref:Uncharacterized protein LOC118416647 n=1 Tax=Branchiostoma floridae TaxID=7739 RepID=A0A9J7L831_BRAFL|nr:uncharacterized protein LOC118416647 [Branchiostoma floridae]XP_035677711.1 uncharacterized protein LOC118416647 [Branchiostoma floridae]